MLTRGLQELEKLLPGFRAEMNAAGAVDVPTPLDWTIFDDRMGGLLDHKYTVFDVRPMCGCAPCSLVELVVFGRLCQGDGCLASAAHSQLD